MAGDLLLMDQEHSSVVAVVDDDDDVGEVLRGLLETMGYHVETYRSGAEFLAGFRSRNIACLVVDQNMPAMTGLELCSHLSKLGISIPTLLITGTPDADIRRRATELGVMTVLEKPMSHRELLRFVAFSMG
jgi:FixJ family two-component response regulator